MTLAISRRVFVIWELHCCLRKIQTSDRRRYAQISLTAAISKPFNPVKLAGQIAAALGWRLEQ